MCKKILLFWSLLFSVYGFTQPIPPISAIPNYFDAQMISLFSQTESMLREKKAALKSKVELFNAKCAAVKESEKELVAQCETEQADIKKMKLELIGGILVFNKDIIIQSDKFFAVKEEKDLNNNFDSWITTQHTLVQSAVAADANWTNEFLQRLKGFPPPESSFQPKGLSDLKNGDVLLIYPKTLRDKAIDRADKFYNSYGSSENLKACHGLVFIGRDASGRCLFLNNTAKSYLHPEDNPGGPHIIGQTEFEQLYGSSDYYVARPRAVVDGKMLLQAAKDMHIKAGNKITIAGSAYGVLGDDMVCTVSSDNAVAHATGRQPVDRKKFIDVTPNNFFDKEATGRYYIISPIVKSKPGDSSN